MTSVDNRPFCCMICVMLDKLRDFFRNDDGSADEPAYALRSELTGEIMTTWQRAMELARLVDSENRKDASACANRRDAINSRRLKQ